MDKCKIRAVLFDFDGVICQTEVCRMDQREAFLRGFGLHIDRRALYRLVGSSNRSDRAAQMDALFGDQPVYRANRDAILSQHMTAPNYAALLTPGLVPVLSRLYGAGLCLAVVSNSSRELIDSALRQCHIRNYFSGIFSGWDSPVAKPDPHIYLEAMKLLHLSPAHCLIVEDSAAGIRAGKAAGCFVAALRDRDGMIDQNAADIVLTNLRQLLPLLDL